MASILVTGANGFVGKALCNLLESEGRLVTRAVRSKLGSHEVAVGDIGSATNWSGALEDCTSVVHLAARVHVMRDTGPASVSAYREVNTAGTLALAEQAAVAGVRRFVYLSSVKVNGEATVLGKPFRSSDKPGPQDPYGVSKREAEDGLAAVAYRTGMEIVVVRSPLVYGPGVRANFHSMMKILVKGIPLPLGCATHNRRSLVSLDNLVDLLKVCIDHPAAANRTFLASDGEDLSTADLLRRLGNAMGKPARLLNVPLWLLKVGAQLVGREEVARRLLGSLQVDICETRDVLGWRPPISVDEGLRRACKSFQG